jgi:hypothetical protein
MTGPVVSLVEGLCHAHAQVVHRARKIPELGGKEKMGVIREVAPSVAANLESGHRPRQKEERVLGVGLVERDR